MWWWCGAGRQGRYNFPLVIFGLRAIVVVAVVDCKSQITRPLLTKTPLLPLNRFVVVPLPLLLLLLVTLLLLLAVVLMSLLLLALVLLVLLLACCPEARHAGGWGFTLPRGPPRGRLGL